MVCDGSVGPAAAAKTAVGERADRPALTSFATVPQGMVGVAALLPMGSGPEGRGSCCREATSRVLLTPTSAAGVSGDPFPTATAGIVASPVVAGIDKSLSTPEPRWSFSGGLVARATSAGAESVASVFPAVSSFATDFRPVCVRRAKSPTATDPAGEGFGGFATSKPAAVCLPKSTDGAGGLSRELSARDVAAADCPATA